MNTTTTTMDRIGKHVPIPRDRVIVAMLLILAAVSLVDTDQVARSIGFVFGALLHIAPFFIAAVLFAAYAKASGMDHAIAAAFSGRTAAAVVVASLAGALSPFCSCGVVPIIAGMLAAGVPLAPVMAFCLASPLMDPETFLITTAAIGLDFAVARTAAALALGMLSGFTVMGLQRLGYMHHVLRREAGQGCSGTTVDNGASAGIAWRFWRDASRRGEFGRQVRTNGGFLGKWMILAFLIESLMLAYIPSAWVAGFMGQENALAIPLAALIGVPAYMNGYAAIPLVSGLMTLGMTKGAALTFVTAGAVSSIPAAMAVYALLRRPVFLVYLIMGFAGSLTAGYAYQLLGAG